MKKISYFLLFFCISSLVYAQKFESQKSSSLSFDTLIGSLPSLIKNSDRPYIVTSNIEVPPDKTVTIEPGTIFLFKNFSGLHIRGRLIARGTPEKPIVFTSEFDRNYNPSSSRNANPFDWDGIYMTSNSLGTQIVNAVIAYSVYCINSESKFIRLDPIKVIENGKSVITIEQNEYPLTDSIFTYTLDKTDISQEGLGVDLFKDPVAKKRTFLRILGSAFLLGGAGSGIYYAIDYNNTYKNLKALSQPGFDNLNPHTSKDWISTDKRLTSDKWYIGASAMVLISGFTLFSWTFTF